MCGIIGYTGSEDVREVLLDALELLEYRGYDSAGIALRDEESGKTEVRKCAGRVSDLRAICASEKVVSQCGIGHTRWATHGGVNDCNAHPHQVGKVTLVHNGIIENYRELIADYDLADTLKSETDSEVVAALLNRFYEGNPEEAIKKTVSKLKGTFALVILFEDQKDVIYSTRNVSPIVATICKEGAMLASDLTALCRFTNRYFVVPEYHILKLSADKLTLTDFDGNEVLPKYLTVDWELNSAGKNGYPFYMEKRLWSSRKPSRIPSGTVSSEVCRILQQMACRTLFYRVRAYLHRSVRNRNARGTGGTGARQVHSSHAH